jgi:succinate dehydrogenase/fumarate reductase flavoprotein subunit
MTPEEAAVPEVSMWAGGYTADAGGSGIGIMRLTVDPITGDLAVTGTAVETPSPSFLLARGDMVYAVGEAAGFGGGGMHGYNSLEGTFVGGCMFSGRAAGRALAKSL